MTKPKIYVDGHAGTTGLRIREWLADRRDVELLTLPEAARKDSAARRERVLAADAAVLCLPDEAAQEVAQWVAGSRTRVIDTSTAHRVADGWVYGLPELQPGQRSAISQAQLVSNPGCYASAVILLLRPLVDAGVLAVDAAIVVHALSGYSGGGRAMIERWEDPARNLRALPYEAPYAFERVHKHIPEIVRHTGLRAQPQFLPAVGPFRCGMRVQVPLHAALLSPGVGGAHVWEVLRERYEGEVFVKVLPWRQAPEPDESFDPRACNDSNRIELRVLPHPAGHVVLMATLDNLGKGACGVAIQNLNLLLGFEEAAGLPA